TTAPAVAATTATTAVAAAGAVAATAARARGALAGLADVDGTALDLAAAQLLGGGAGLGVAAHLDEGEAARPARVAIENDLHLHDVPAPLGKDLSQFLFSDVVGQISDVEPRSHGV